MTIQDFGVTYAELEPITTSSRNCADSGQAGNLRGTKVEAATFEGPRSSEFPNKPLSAGFGRAVRGSDQEARLSPVPAALVQCERRLHQSRRRDHWQCVYCGFCERFGCESNAKASPT